MDSSKAYVYVYPIFVVKVEVENKGTDAEKIDAATEKLEEAVDLHNALPAPKGFEFADFAEGYDAFFVTLDGKDGLEVYSQWYHKDGETKNGPGLDLRDYPEDERVIRRLSQIAEGA